MYGGGTHSHAHFVVGVTFLGHSVRDRVEYVDFQEVGRSRVRVVQRLFLDVQPSGRLGSVDHRRRRRRRRRGH